MHANIHTYIHIQESYERQIQELMCVCIYTHKYIHACKHTYIHTYIHIQESYERQIQELTESQRRKDSQTKELVCMYVCMYVCIYTHTRTHL